MDILYIVFCNACNTKYGIGCLLLILSSCGISEKGDSLTLKRFKKMDEEVTNIHFKNLIPETVNMNNMVYEYYYNGGGVALADLDNDGLPELFFTSNLYNNKLYKNLGNFKFKDITKESGITNPPSWTTGVSLADINNDGILDIYISRSGKLDAKKRENSFFISTGMEDGVPRYVEKAKSLGLADEGYSTQALFFDYDKDGDLDMFLLNHNVEVKIQRDLESIRNQRDPLVGDKLFRNDGMKFTDVSEESGIIGNSVPAPSAPA